MPPVRFRLLRATAAFIALPGIVAGVIPWYLRPVSITPNDIGSFVIAIGVALLLWCVRDFYVSGRGTLAPWDPPRHLVVVGLYRVTRNPMYVAVLVVLCGWALAFGTRTLWTYAVAVALLFHLRVVLFEEPRLERTFGDEYRSYRARVPRWLLQL